VGHDGRHPTPDGVTGLHHVALAYPSRKALADAGPDLDLDDLLKELD
jgi:hypothetical protein